MPRSFKTIVILVLLLMPALTQDYSPSIEYSLEPPYANSSTDLIFTVSQDFAEFDTELFEIFFDAGSLIFDGLSQNTIIGTGYGIFLDNNCDEEFANGAGNFGPGYLCPAGMDSEVTVQVSIYYLNPGANELGAIMTILQSNNPEYPIGFSPAGILMQNIVQTENMVGVRVEVAYLQPDQEDVTQGYISHLEMNNIYNTPDAGLLPVTAVFTSETGIILEDLQYLEIIENIIPGDANMDGNVDVLDVVLIVDHILQNSQLNADQMLRGDVNHDDIVDVLDVVIIVEMILNA